VDCFLEGSQSLQNNMLLSLEEKIQNWNKINMGICFNYLKADFYLVKGTISQLARGNSDSTVIKVLR